MTQELVEYVFQQQQSGVSNEAIRSQLRMHGWKEEQIALAFNEAEVSHENKKWTIYSVGSIILIFVVSLAFVGAAKYTGFVPSGKIACLMENPKHPGYYDLVESQEDCLKIAVANVCDPLSERLAVESEGKVLFEGARSCKGDVNLYFPAFSK